MVGGITRDVLCGGVLEGWTPLPDDALRRYRDAGVFEDHTVGEIVDRAAERFGSRTAIVFGARSISYAELRERTERLADHFVRIGLRPNDRVVVQLPNVPEFVDVYFALAKIGALPILALPAHRAREIGHFVGHSQAVAYVIPREFRGFDHLALARELRDSHPSLRHVFVVDRDFEGEPGWQSIDRLLESEPPPRPLFRPDPFGVALFLLSGGTTGLSKLIPRTHADYVYNSRLAGRIVELGRESVTIVAIPAAHNFPLAWAIQPSFLVGGKIVLVPQPNPAEILTAIERERATYFPAVPALHQSVMDVQEKERRDVSSLRQIIAGGAKFVASAAERAYRVLGCEVQQVFGMAEGFATGTRLGDPKSVVLDTVGRPYSEFDEFRLVDSEGRDVPPGEIGELLVRGPYTIRGYYRAAEHNATSFTADGFYRSGDLLRLDRDGNLVVEGRSKDFINRGGEKVSAEEIEDLLADHPAIERLALVAMPDRITGEKGCLFVVLKPGAKLDLDDVRAHLETKRVARFKFPERIEVVDAFPLTAVGKVSRRELRELVQRKLGGER